MKRIKATSRAAALASLIAALTLFGGDARAQFHGQQGVTRVACNADNVHIYRETSTGSQRLGTMRRGWAFRVYHYVDGNWAFGVHNSTRTAGYVLRGKLCVR
jgi:hypothetical protein